MTSLRWPHRHDLWRQVACGVRKTQQGSSNHYSSVLVGGVLGLGLCQRPVASRRDLGAHEHDSILPVTNTSAVSSPSGSSDTPTKDGGKDRLGQGVPDWLVSRPPQGHGPVRPMAHVARLSREQDLMHATRVGCSSPDGSPSFRGQFAPGDWRLGRPQRPNPRRTGRSLKQRRGVGRGRLRHVFFSPV